MYFSTKGKKRIKMNILRMKVIQLFRALKSFYNLLVWKASKFGIACKFGTLGFLPTRNHLVFRALEEMGVSK